jgi:CheY-like chemotaxis protein
MAARVLVVDDEPSVVAMLRIAFGAYGYTVASAGSAAEACRLLAEQQFELVVTDMKMETSTSGFVVSRTARLQPNDPVVIILTSYPVLPEAWRAAGADAAVNKPADIAELMKLVAALLAR